MHPPPTHPQPKEPDESYISQMVQGMKGQNVTLQVICLDEVGSDAAAAANRSAGLEVLQGIIEETGSKEAK